VNDVDDRQSLSDRFLGIKRTLQAQNRSGENDHVEAVVAVLLLEDHAGTLSILIIRRKERDDDPWSGQMGLPGGRVEKTDPSTKYAVEREVREEVGIDLRSAGEALGLLTLGHPMRRTGIQVQPWVYGLKQKPRVDIGPEVQEAVWVPISKLRPNSTTAQVRIREEVRDVPAFVIDGRIIWGFTHRVLSELLEIPEVGAQQLERGIGHGEH
jgi:8-oxo-dGTP pyrophosphatase MutT (NUDIX family)